MQDITYICTTDYSDYFGKGTTVEEAFLNYENITYDHAKVEDCIFYECKKINVKQKLEIVEEDN